MFKSIHINNYITCKEIKHSNWKTRIIKLLIFLRQKKKINCSLQEMKKYTLHIRIQYRMKPVGDMKWWPSFRSLTCDSKVTHKHKTKKSLKQFIYIKKYKLFPIPVFCLASLLSSSSSHHVTSSRKLSWLSLTLNGVKCLR